MSDFPPEDRPGWWQASDRKWYPPELHPDHQLPPPPTGVTGLNEPPAAQPTDSTYPVGQRLAGRRTTVIAGVGLLLALIAAGVAALALSRGAEPGNPSLQGSCPEGKSLRDGDCVPSTAALPPSTSTTTSTTTTVIDPLAQSEWQADGGWRYRATLSSGPSSTDASPLGCHEVPEPGKRHLQFQVVIENLIDDRKAPLPQILFASNATLDGLAIDPQIVSVEGSQRIGEIEMDSTESGTKCWEAGKILSLDDSTDVSPEGVIPPGGSVTVNGVLADVAYPPPPGLAIFGRAFADEAAGSPPVIDLRLTYGEAD